MRRRLALRAEVFAGLDEAAAEELLPEAIDVTRAVSGLSRLDQPAREPEPVRRSRRRAASRAPRARPAPRRRFRVAELRRALEHVRHARLGQLGHHHARRQAVAQSLELGAARVERGARARRRAGRPLRRKTSRQARALGFVGRALGRRLAQARRASLRVEQERRRRWRSPGAKAQLRERWGVAGSPRSAHGRDCGRPYGDSLAQHDAPGARPRRARAAAPAGATSVRLPALERARRPAGRAVLVEHAASAPVAVALRVVGDGGGERHGARAARLGAGARLELDAGEHEVAVGRAAGAGRAGVGRGIARRASRAHFAASSGRRA